MEQGGGMTPTSLMCMALPPLTTCSSRRRSRALSTALGRLWIQSRVRDTKMFWSRSFWYLSSSNWEKRCREGGTCAPHSSQGGQTCHP